MRWFWRQSEKKHFSTRSRDSVHPSATAATAATAATSPTAMPEAISTFAQDDNHKQAQVPTTVEQRQTASPRPPRQVLDLPALMHIKSLELRAKMIVEGYWSGLHRSPYHGFSVEFTEYRQYTPGDDPRYLDWRLYARSDRFYIKRFEDETNLRCHLVVDGSRSMGFGAPYSKSQYAVTLAATLAYFLAGQRDAVGLITFDDCIREVLPARYRPGHLRQLLLALERPLPGHATNLDVPLRAVADMLRKRGMVVLFSDLLAPLDSLATHLGWLRARGHEVVVIQILDRAELDFSFEHPALFQDMESGENFFVEPDRIRADYSRRLQEHCGAVQSACARLGVEYRLVPSDSPPRDVLHDFLTKRLANKASMGRSARRGGR